MRRSAVAGRGGRRLPEASPQLEPLEEASALAVRERQRGVAVEVEEVDDHVADRDVAHTVQNFGLFAQAHPTLE